MKLVVDCMCLLLYWCSFLICHFAFTECVAKDPPMRSTTNNRDTICKTVRYINTYIYLVYLFSNKIANILDIK